MDIKNRYMLCIILTLPLGKSVTLVMMVMTREYFYWFTSIKFNFRVVHAKNNTIRWELLCQSDETAFEVWGDEGGGGHGNEEKKMERGRAREGKQTAYLEDEPTLLGISLLQFDFLWDSTEKTYAYLHYLLSRLISTEYLKSRPVQILPRCFTLTWSLTFPPPIICSCKEKN